MAYLYRLSEDLINQQGVSLQQALHLVRHVLPKEAILVGQNIGKDVQWLELKEGSDFQVSVTSTHSCKHQSSC